MGRKLALLATAAAAGALIVPYVLSEAATTPLENLNLADVACAIVDKKLNPKGLGMSSEQIRNAGTIVSVGAQMGVPVRGRVVAVATAMQESNLRNIPYGDRDSKGLFQQRPSMNWGSASQVMNPVYSASKFYSRLIKVPGWQNMKVTDAAQAVQHSGFPDAYAQHEQKAVQIVASANSTPGGVQQVNSSSGCTPLSIPASANVTGYVSAALGQVGKPYEWGGTGPDTFDCSGLIVWAWRQKGYQLKVRTSQDMYEVAVPVASGQERSGDLIFTQFQSGGPAHVMIVVRPGTAVEAPRTGLDVRVRTYDPATEDMKFGRLPASQMDAITAQA
ncbi:C40 family peptidase [Streptomyces sp. NPDC059009]|uniref:C40 family peptidase n=1 Tax=Streptomyces sp. NPDC059009 TaxID=3346694 RepID=UPI0036894B8E